MELNPVIVNLSHFVDVQTGMPPKSSEFWELSTRRRKGRMIDKTCSTAGRRRPAMASSMRLPFPVAGRSSCPGGSLPRGREFRR